ncbi:hypothetical protein ILYODFUR_024581 [Ilyodon furcidens]|uniref:Uncharacterized protein n=1 Tax=Ilyodon furcidens TaxID=33524 RepID=A0ABV0SZV4_9TELE
MEDISRTLKPGSHKETLKAGSRGEALKPEHRGAQEQEHEVDSSGHSLKNSRTGGKGASSNSLKRGAEFGDRRQLGTGSGTWKQLGEGSGAFRQQRRAGLGALPTTFVTAFTLKCHNVIL